MRKSPSVPDARETIEKAIGRIRAYGIDGPRPIEEIEAVLQHGDAIGPALAAAIEAVDKTRLAEAIHLVALLRSSEALPAVNSAAFEAPAPLEAKSEALAAYEACGQKPPGQMVEQMEIVRDLLSSPDLASVEKVLAWSPSWRAPALERWLQDAEAEQIELVATLMGRDSELDRDLLDWLGGQATQRAVEIVEEYVSSAPDRERVKDAKRALHRLKGKGLELSQADGKQEEGVFTLALESHAPDRAQAYITSFDGRGSRLLWILWPSAAGGNRLLQAVLEDTGGLTRADLIPVSRNEFRAHLERLRSNPALLVGRMEIQDATHRLASAAHKSTARGAALPPAYEEWIAMAKPAGVDVEAEPGDVPARIYSRLDGVEVEGSVDMIDAAIELLRESYFSSWAVTGEAVDRAVEQIRDAEHSTLMINDEQRQTRMQDALREAVEESFDSEARALYRRRLEAMAHLLWDEQGETAARQALAAAVGFTDVGDLFDRHAFARALVHRGVWLAYQERAREDAAEEKRTGVIRP